VDGYELVRRIRAQGSPLAQVPVIALTAYAREEDRRLALAAGFSEHLIKPVDPNQLCRVTAELIGRAKA
jgi:CheY-like chemotaxis protein